MLKESHSYVYISNTSIAKCKEETGILRGSRMQKIPIQLPTSQLAMVIRLDIDHAITGHYDVESVVGFKQS